MAILAKDGLLPAEQEDEQPTDRGYREESFAWRKAEVDKRVRSAAELLSRGSLVWIGREPLDR